MEMIRWKPLLIAGGQVSELQKRGRVVVSNPPPICFVPMLPAVQNSSWCWPSASIFFLLLLIGLTPPSSLPLVQGMPGSPAAIPVPGWREAPTVDGQSSHTQAPDSPLGCGYVCFFSIPRRLQTLQHCHDCRVRLRQHCEPAVPRAVAFGSSQCSLLWARPRASSSCPPCRAHDSERATKQARGRPR
jgi:hypothetical protein